MWTFGSDRSHVSRLENLFWFWNKAAMVSLSLSVVMNQSLGQEMDFAFTGCLYGAYFISVYILHNASHRWDPFLLTFHFHFSKKKQKKEHGWLDVVSKQLKWRHARVESSEVEVSCQFAINCSCSAMDLFFISQTEPCCFVSSQAP